MCVCVCVCVCVFVCVCVCVFLIPSLFSDDPSTVAMVKSVVESVYGDPLTLQRVLSNIGQHREKVERVCKLRRLPCYHGYF